MPTPFEAGKTARELGIDTSRKFAVVSNGKGEIFRTGDIVKLSGSAPFAVEPGATFQNKQGDEETMFWRELAYADDEAKPEPYQPRVGDRVSVEVTVVELESEIVWLRGHGVLMGVDRSEVSCLTLLSRKTRTLTKAEAEALLTEKLGEQIIIE